MQFIGCATLLDIDRKCYVGFAKTDLGLGKQSTNGAVGEGQVCAALLKSNCSDAKASGNRTDCQRCISHLRRAPGNATGAANCTSRQLSEFCSTPRKGGAIELRKCAPVAGLPKFFSVATCSQEPRFQECVWSNATCVYTPYFPPGP
jgi:hypothetical protein